MNMLTLSKTQYTARPLVGPYVASAFISAPNPPTELVDTMAHNCVRMCTSRVAQDNKVITSSEILYIPDWDMVDAPGGAIMMSASTD